MRRAGVDTFEPVPRSFSPTRLALRRLRGHRLAMGGLGLLACILLLVLFGNRLVPTEAATTRVWIGARPPGFAHPHCRARTALTTGAAAELPEVLQDAAKLTFVLQPNRVLEYRIALRRGKISTITQGATPLQTLDLAGVQAPAHERLLDGTAGRTLPAVTARVGEGPPTGLMTENQRVLILGIPTPEPKQTLHVRLRDGTVTDMVRETDDRREPVGKVSIPGQHVLEVRADGDPQVLRHPLGTDELGRDLLMRVVNGGRVSLAVGVVATFVSLVVGIAYGATAGYAGGRTDSVMMRSVDVLYGLPFIFLVLLLMVVFDRNIILLFVALGLVQWLTMARIVRGQMLSLRQEEFVSAARMSGCGPFRIIFSHLIPHTLGPVIVYATLTVPVVILEESFLAFIGLPVQYQGTTLDSWGSLVHLGMAGLGEGGQKWWLLVFPSLAMVLTLFALNCVGDGLRDSFDPKGAVR